MRALLLKHEPTTEPGGIGERLAERGYELTVDLVVPADRYHSPDVTFAFPDPADWDLIVPLGSPWSVYDEKAIGTWVHDELAFLRRAHELGVPVLGICFGAQALAAALGGAVVSAAHPEIGWYDIETDDPALVSAGPWFQWHYDRCVLPPGAVEVARNASGPQAYTIGRSLGVQFHPEITPDVVAGWIAEGGAEQCVSLGVDPGELHERSKAMDAAARERAGRLVDGFLDSLDRASG
jgi:GMP synthase-like glutamine amidotransferase